MTIPAACGLVPSSDPSPNNGATTSTSKVASTKLDSDQVETQVDDGPVEPGTLIRVEIQPCAGLGLQRATALAVGPDYALTAAHSFVGAKAATLRFSDDAGNEMTVEAHVAVSDIDKDIAVIKPATSLDMPWASFVLGEPEVGSAATIETYADIDGPVTKQAEVLRLVNATLDGAGRRAAVELEADIDPGDSGAPVLNSNGRAIAMVFASSRTSERGWAIRSSELATTLQEFADNNDGSMPIDLGFQCTQSG